MNYKNLTLTLMLTLSSLMAEESNSDNLIDIERTGKWMAFPYIFSSDSTGFAGGVAAIATGLLQPQTTLVTSIFYGAEQDIISNDNPTTDNFSGGLVSFTNLKIPYTHRLYFSLFGLMSHYPLDRLYLDGSNESNQDDGLTTAGDSDQMELSFKYVLPIGDGISNPDGLYNLKNGFAMGRENFGGGTPFITGRTSLSFNYFYHHQTIENWKETEPWSLSSSMPDWNDSGFRIKIDHDNTDFDLNPSRGYSFMLQYSTDGGGGDNLQSWDNLEFKYSQYLELKPLSFTKQNVLAMNFWTAYSPSWDTNREYLPGIDRNRAPLWEGPRLGGFTRMRGYDTNRFSDKAAIYATAEYRAILNWNPFNKGLIGEWMPADVDWLQVVGFAEVGRVNDAYDFDLFTDLKYDVGVSLRAMVAEVPVRFEVAYGEEGTSMWVMYKQPFDF